MNFNNAVRIEPIGDSFSQAEVAEEPAYTALYLEDARRKGPLSRFMVDVVLANQPFFASLQGSLVLRNDKFELRRGNAPQRIHVDNPLGLKQKWRPTGIQGLMVFGTGTGKTDVLNPFEVPFRERVHTLAGFHEIASIVEQQRAHCFMEHYETGVLIVSDQPIFHGRGETGDGHRSAFDFGLVEPKDLHEEGWILTE